MKKQHNMYLSILFLALTMLWQETKLQAQNIIFYDYPWFVDEYLPFYFESSNYIISSRGISVKERPFMLLPPRDQYLGSSDLMEKAKKTKYASFGFEEDNETMMEDFARICRFPNIKVFTLFYPNKGFPQPFPVCFKDTSIEVLIIYSNAKNIQNFEKSPLPKDIWAGKLVTYPAVSRKMLSSFLAKFGTVKSLRSFVFIHYRKLPKDNAYGVGGYCPNVGGKKRYFFTLPRKLTKLCNLEELSIPNVDLFNQKNIKVLAQMTSLKRLAVHVCPKKKFDYEELAQLRFLEELYLAYPINGMDFIEKLRPLFKKYLPDTKIIIEKDPSK